MTKNDFEDHFAAINLKTMKLSQLTSWDGSADDTMSKFLVRDNSLEISTLLQNHYGSCHGVLKALKVMANTFIVKGDKNSMTRREWAQRTSPNEAVALMGGSSIEFPEYESAVKNSEAPFALASALLEVALVKQYRVKLLADHKDLQSLRDCMATILTTCVKQSWTVIRQETHTGKHYYFPDSLGSHKRPLFTSVSIPRDLSKIQAATDHAAKEQKFRNGLERVAKTMMGSLARTGRKDGGAVLIDRHLVQIGKLFMNVSFCLRCFPGHST